MSDTSRQSKATGKKPGWRVVDASYELSSPDMAHCPAPDLPELAVTGRSNVGKSSLLNKLSARKGLARVSRTPGRTRMLNFFLLRLRPPSGDDIELRLVDLPGYGFAKAHKRIREHFGPMIGGYVQRRSALRGLLCLIDARRGPSELDLDMLEFASECQLPCLVVATKCDKLSKSERGLVPAQFAKALGIRPRDVVLSSAQSGIGIDKELKGGGLMRELARLSREPARVGLADDG